MAKDPTRERAPRLESLDVFRGVAIAAMILVSTPGTWSAVYPPLDHAVWNGWTPTDLVFPFLLFAMGAAVPLSMARRRRAERPAFARSALRRGRPELVHILRRASVLFLLGLVLNAIEAPPPLALETFRIPGVLQRIAIVYVAVALVAGTLSLRAQIAAAAVALIGYWMAMTLVPVPGAGAGVLTPSGNLASFVDRAVFGRHMLAADFDPEGLLSTVPAVATALMGAFAGRWLQTSKGESPTIYLLIAGTAAVAAGLLWGRFFPINKTLWTSSFALFSAGVATLVLAFCHSAVNVAPVKPLAAFGRNALAAYFLSVGLDSMLTRITVVGTTSAKAMLFRVGFASWLRPCCGAEAASFGYALAYLGLWTIVFAEMHRRRIFIGI